MRNLFTTKVLLVALFAYCATEVYSQIDGLDATKYYIIYNRNSKHAMGVDNENKSDDGALIAQQEVDESDVQLWEIRVVTDSTYLFINKESGMALGLTEWRGLNNPFWGGDAAGTKDEQLTMPGYSWTGEHRGACQRELNESDETQIWQPTIFPNNPVDTIFYRMTMAMNLIDSGFCFNVWERNITVGMRDIAVFPGTQEAALYNDYTSLYSYIFNITTIEVPVVSVNSISSDLNTDIYTNQGTIVVRGKIEGTMVEVYSILGTRVYSTLAKTSELKININEGIYIVKAGNFVTKVTVR